MAQSVFGQVGNPSSIIMRIELHFIHRPISVIPLVVAVVVAVVSFSVSGSRSWIPISFLSLSKILHNRAFSSEVIVDFFFLVLVLLGGGDCIV